MTKHGKERPTLRHNLDVDDLENRIKYHRPNEHGISRIGDMRRFALDWAKAVSRIVPPGREQSIALTKIEEALMWSIAGIARDPGYWAEDQD